MYEYRCIETCEVEVDSQRRRILEGDTVLCDTAIKEGASRFELVKHTRGSVNPGPKVDPRAEALNKRSAELAEKRKKAAEA